MAFSMDEDKGSGTVGEGAQADPLDTAAAAADATAAPEARAPESFIDPSDLPEELKPHWKRMHRAYTKKLEGLSEVQKKAALVDRFNGDRDFALQTIRQAAQARGVTVGEVKAAIAAPSAAPPELVAQIESTLSPELKWMAPALANAQWAGMQMTLKPEQDRRAAESHEQRAAQYETLAEELTRRAPGWEEHEDEMEKLLVFLQGEAMTDKHFGSKLELLHSIVTGNAAAITAAARRMGEAARSRTTSGQIARSTSNIADRVRKAKTDSDAWDAAVNFAKTELERGR